MISKTRVHDGFKPTGDVLTAIGLTAYALAPVLSSTALTLTGALLLVATLRPLAADGRCGRAARAIVALLLLFAGTSPWYAWPLPLLVPLVGAALLAWALGFSSIFPRVLRRGAFGRGERFAIGAIAVLSAMALAGWMILVRPDLSAQRSSLPLGGSPLSLLLLGLAFSVVNATLEETVWRGVLLAWLAERLPAALAVAIQALSFGAAHYFGVPSGFIGVALATVYGLMMGALARHSRGLLAPIVAHVAADAVVFTLLIVAAGR